jgi:RNA 2',3'-cyclic 3'-phosphodiesterase
VEKVRAFIAIEVPGAVREKLGTLQRQLEETIPKEAVRWTPVEQIHVTLQFLGGVAADDLPAMRDALPGVAIDHTQFEVGAEGLGAFPSMRNPRVLWSAVTGEVETLKALQSDVAGIMRPWSAKEESRAYRPHLTLGRVRDVPTRDVRKIATTLARSDPGDFGKWTVSEFVLMQSKLSPHGAQHSVLASFSLSGDKA